MEPQREPDSEPPRSTLASKRLLRYAVATTTLAVVMFFAAGAVIFGPGLGVGSGGADVQDSNSDEPVTVAMVRLVGGGAVWPSYLDVLSHIAESTGRPVETIFLYGPDEAMGLFKNHPEADGAFMSTYGYLLARDLDPRITRAVTPVINGLEREQAVLVVRADSPYEHLRDLAGTRVLLMERSLAGGAYVRWLLANEGMEPAEEFFGDVETTGSQEENLRRVIAGEADVTAANLSQLASWPQNAFRVIAISEEYGMPPFVISPDLSESEAEALVGTLLSYEASQEGMGNGELERFLLADPSGYEFPLELFRYLGSAALPVGGGSR